MGLLRKNKKKRVDFESAGAGDDELPEIEHLEAPSPPLPKKKMPRRNVSDVVAGKKPTKSFPKYPDEELSEASEAYEREEAVEDNYILQERRKPPSFDREFRVIARKVVTGGYFEEALILLQDEKALFDFYTLQKRTRLYGSKKI